jgi:hypothetical protein
MRNSSTDTSEGHCQLDDKFAVLDNGFPELRDSEELLLPMTNSSNFAKFGQTVSAGSDAK